MTIKKGLWKPQIISIIVACMLAFTACGSADDRKETDLSTMTDAVVIELKENEILVDEKPIDANEDNAVYTANDIVYYESGKDFTYGEGTEQDAHSQSEADAHTVVHITQAGTYVLSGTLSQGQIAVDLGEDAKKDPDAVVTLILNGVDITCEVAPAIIFYNVYECGDDDADKATKDVDTSAAGVNVIIADGTTNTVRGSYVARIYKPDTVELNDEGTEVKDAKKLHKYDAAFYSRMSMNLSGGSENTGTLAIYAENEGLDSELHLTINGGNISIYSGNDGINTNEDGVSVTTINGGVVQIQVTGETGEGDGIDSNGWLVINGGTVIAEACSRSMDAGVDSDMGIHVNGGTLMATGHMLDRIEDGGQTYAVFNFAQEQNGSTCISLKNAEGATVMECVPGNDYSILVFSSPDLTEGTYTLWSGETPLAVQSNGMAGGFGKPGEMPGGMPGGMRPEGGNPPEVPQGEMPEGFDGQFPQGEPPQNQQEGNQGEPPAGNQQPPEEGERPDRPENAGGNQWRPNNDSEGQQGLVTEFKIHAGGNLFSDISYLE